MTEFGHDARMVDYTNAPAVHIFADGDAAAARMRRTAEAAGCRVASALPVGDGAASSAAPPGGVILIELERDVAGGTAALLDWLQRDAGQNGRRGIVSAPVQLIDLVAASVNHPMIEHLCEATEAERQAAIARAVVPLTPRLRDEGNVGGARVLQRSADYAPEPAGPDELPFIQAMLRARRLRGEHLPADLFADPAWDILLDLMVARLERKRVTVSSLCVAAAVPPTTALRWIATLTGRGLLVRAVDSADRRRAFVGLSDIAARALGTWLLQARRLASEAL